MTACDGGVSGATMPQAQRDAFAIGLSEAEKDDLEKMIGEFRRQGSPDPATDEREPLQDQLDRINRKLADLTEMFLRIDRRLEPLVEVIRLSHQKSDLLNRRLDAVIDALKKGRPL